MLAHTLRAKGQQIRWCQEAEVCEYVPASRSQRDWVFRRTIRTSNTWSRVGMRLTETSSERWRKRAELTVRGAHRILRGLAVRGSARVRGDVSQDARGAVDVASGIGVLMGAYGRVRTEYGRTDL